MSDDSVHSASGLSLSTLGEYLYQKALVRRADEPITDPRGQPISWMLDTRVPLLEAETFQKVGRLIADRLRRRSVFQVAGMGFGAFPLVGAVLSTPGKPSFRGGLIREHRKLYGRRRWVEGPLCPEEPVVILDDILNSGKSALRAVDALLADGYRPVGVIALFHFTWNQGEVALEQKGLWVDSLLSLNLQHE